MTLIQFMVAILLYFVIFFSIAFILNMLLRQLWLMAGIYPLIMILMLTNDRKDSVFDYFTIPKEAFGELFEQTIALGFVDITLFIVGFIGTIASGLVIKFLRRSGYQMF